MQVAESFLARGHLRKNAKEQASPFRLRIQARDLICRHDLDLWLSVAKMDCAPDAERSARRRRFFFATIGIPSNF